MKRSKEIFSVKRVYEPVASADGTRLLVERLWPRGVRKEALKLDGWLRGVAPSTALRKWFSHDPTKWQEFKRRYRAELDANPEAWREILRRAEPGPVTLLFSSRDAEHNNVVVLREYVEARAGRSRRLHPVNVSRCLDGLSDTELSCLSSRNREDTACA